MGRRKQRSTREKTPAQPRLHKPPAAPQATALPPARPPRRNLPLLVFSIALFLAWLAALTILAIAR